MSIDTQVVQANGGAPGPLRPAEVQAFAGTVRRLADGIESVVYGKPYAVRLALTALLSEGHLLVEDVPGVGKTTLARALAAVAASTCRRIQFTPDLLPADVTGVTVYNQATRGFEFHPGPVFANVVIADEINRASPKTQSALLEVMQERRVTVDGHGYPVPRPFLVVATQNPVEMDGTYRLPEAQLDRFLIKVSMGYPDEAAELALLRRPGSMRQPEDMTALADADTLKALIELGTRIFVAEPLETYAVRLAAATRTHPAVRIGVSPRGLLALAGAARVYAGIAGRGYVLPEDLRELLVPVFAHRLLLTPDAQMRGVTAADVLAEVVESVPVPTPVDR